MAEGAKHVMLEANGMALNAVDMGVQDMPAIVLLAGWPQTLRAWVEDPESIKPGALMPAMKLSREDVDKVTAYLLTLK